MAVAVGRGFFRFGDDQHGDAQNGAVGGDQRQVNPQCLIQAGDELFEEDFDQLHQRRDNQDIDHRLQIRQSVRNQNAVVDRPGDGGGQNHHERDRRAHADGGIQLFGHAQKRADAQEFTQNIVFRQDRCQKNGNQ